MSTSTHFTTPEFAEQWFHTHYKGYNHALSLEERDFLRHRVLEKPVFQNRLIRLRRKLSPAHVGPPCSCRSTSDSLDVQLASFARVRESKSMEGRHLEATRPAPSGSVVLHELPFASLLHERYQGQFCDTCFRKIVIGTRFQCRGCSLVYCSRECELSAWAGDNHAFFCGFDGLVELVGEDGWLCLKAYLRLAQSKETASDVEELMQGETPGDIGDAIQGIPNLIHNLAFHSPNTILTYLTTAILLTATFCLPSSIEPTLVKIQAQLRCNGFGIKCTLHAAAGGMEERREVVLGTGVYLGASLLNHACWPNAMVVFGTRKEEGRVDIDPRELVVVMTREVGRVGEPICMSYGPQVGRMDAEERRRVLREKYLFDCGCEACRERYIGLYFMNSLLYRLPCCICHICYVDLLLNFCSHHMRA
ncbi:hypothetical protein BC938DRAFT_477920 [Jimgerdemannia flammicorona]|uniref:SET domain-containing protein n=1 Tax=Jimgerdemannia flammicorona TaxID=994334 RepID=A0A433QYP1_9FUNG|nr:hypothetical protein BC938DRAFT_477920 [Jimgerdemannia flammicorona]